MTTKETKNTTNTNETTENEKNTVKRTNKKTVGLIVGATVTVAAVLISMLCLSACNDKKPTATADEVVIGTSVQTVTQVVTDAQGNTHIEEETKVVEVKQTQPSEKSENETSADKNNNDKSNSNQSNNSNSSGNNNNQTNLNNNSGNAQSSKTNNSSNSGQTSKSNGSSGSTNKPASNSGSSGSSSQSKPSSGSGSSSSSKPAPATQPATKDQHEGKTWHEAIYEEVYHPAETTQEWVPYYIDAPIYEYHEAAICNTCNKEIVGDAGEHMYEHMQKGENGSYRCETVKEIVGYEKVEVPELGHYETKVINEAYTEKRLVQEAGWY